MIISVDDYNVLLNYIDGLEVRIANLEQRIAKLEDKNVDVQIPPKF